jgi:hypothetical protein
VEVGGARRGELAELVREEHGRIYWNRGQDDLRGTIHD